VKRFVVMGLWAVMALGLAAGYPRFESAVLEASQQLAQLELEWRSAEQRARVLADDPYAAPQERDEAEDALERARLRWAEQRLALRQEAYRLWTDVLKGQAQVDVALAALKVAGIRLEAARIRSAKGAASQVELDSAERAHEQASLQLAQARSALTGAKEALASRASAQPDDVPDIQPPEDLNVEGHSKLELARLDVRAAERALAAAEGPDTARVERERREAALRAARERGARLRGQLERRLESLKAQYTRQRRLAELARDAVADAEKKMAAEQLRFDKGLASKLALETARQALVQARADELAARVELGRLALELWAFAEAP